MDMHSIKKARISVYYSRWSRGRKSCGRWPSFGICYFSAWFYVEVL